VWTDDGSPLLTIPRRQQVALEAELRRRYGGPIHVDLGMVNGSPSIKEALARLRGKDCR
jgi:ferrochelatase